jgi:hypothetical protein
VAPMREREKKAKGREEEMEKKGQISPNFI